MSKKIVSKRCYTCISCGRPAIEHVLKGAKDCIMIKCEPCKLAELYRGGDLMKLFKVHSLNSKTIVNSNKVMDLTRKPLIEASKPVFTRIPPATPNDYPDFWDDESGDWFRRTHGIKPGFTRTYKPLVTMPTSLEDLKVYILEDVYREIYYQMHSFSAEVSGLLLAELRDGEVYVIGQEFYGQYSSAAHTELDPVFTANLTNKYINHPEIIKGFWHSHCNMGVSPSTDDLNNPFNFLGFSDWVVSIIINFAEDIYCRVDMVKPIKYSWPKCILKIVPNEEKLVEIRSRLNPVMSKTTFTNSQPIDTKLVDVEIVDENPEEMKSISIDDLNDSQEIPFKSEASLPSNGNSKLLNEPSMIQTLSKVFRRS